MNSGELRINNWLTDEDGKHYRIATGKNIDDVVKSRGIRLVPEILEKCGFRLEFNRASRFFGPHNSLVLEIFPDGSTNLYLKKEGSEPTKLPNNVIYLHQLQNLFYALCGEELEVEL